MEESFSSYIKGDQILFKYAKGVGALRGREFHEYHELILFIDGDVDFYSDELHISLKPDQLVIIPKEHYHQFVIKSDEQNYKRCVFSFYETPVMSDFLSKAFNNVRVIDANEFTLDLFKKVIDLSESEESDSKRCILVSSFLMLFINEISSIIPDDKTSKATMRSPLMTKCIDYINENLFDDLSIDKLSRVLNVSESTISHAFTKEMRISPYRYILQKRLVNAQNRIASGESATAVAIDCGFSDYSGFYKQYKKAFGITPSSNKGYFK